MMLLLCIYVTRIFLTSMSKQIIAKKSKKIPPSMHLSSHNSSNITSYGKYGYFNNKNCDCINPTYVKSNANTLKGKDGATINPFICNMCNNTIYQCQTCGTARNICKNIKAAKRHLREYHHLDNNKVDAIDGNDIEESIEMEFALDGHSDANDLEEDMRNLNFLSDLTSESESYREFIKHFHKGKVKEYLVALSQDKHFSELRCNNVSPIDVSLQIKLSKLRSQMSPTEQEELAEIMQLLLQSLQEREYNDTLYAFASIPCTNTDIQRICSRGKYSILQNIPKPSTEYDGDLCVISAVEAIKNALLLGLNISLIRAHHCVEDMDKCVNNAVVHGKNMRKEIMKLAEKCNKTGIEIVIIPCSQFRDGFLPCKSVATNAGLLLHTLTFQSIDSTYDSSICTYPIALGTKSKNSMITETKYIKDWNQREDPNKPFKVYSKAHKCFLNVVLYNQYMSMDQIEKRSFALFSGGNSKYGAYFGHSCCFYDIANRFIPCKGCNNKSLKGQDNDKCHKCWNLNINRARYSKELVASLGGLYKKPFKLTMEMQRDGSKKVHQSIIDGHLPVTTAKEQLRALCVPSDASKLIIDSAVLMHAKKTDTLNMHDLSSCHPLIDKRNLNNLSFPDFAIYQRDNLTYDKFSCSPMHMLDLGEL